MGRETRENPLDGPRIACVFNIQGSELIFLLLIALIVLGPEKLPDAVRKFGRAYAEFKKMANGFQGEFRSAIDEPLRELRNTADAMRQAVNFDIEPKVVNAAETAPAPAPATTSAPSQTLNFGSMQRPDAEQTPALEASEPVAPANPVESEQPPVIGGGLNFGRLQRDTPEAAAE